VTVTSERGRVRLGRERSHDPDDTNDHCVDAAQPMHRDAAEWMAGHEPFSVRLTQFPGAEDERVFPRRSLLPATISVDPVGVCAVSS
jgi:hypothetical protein